MGPGEILFGGGGEASIACRPTSGDVGGDVTAERPHLSGDAGMHGGPYRCASIPPLVCCETQNATAVQGPKTLWKLSGRIAMFCKSMTVALPRRTATWVQQTPFLRSRGRRSPVPSVQESSARHNPTECMCERGDRIVDTPRKSVSAQVV